MKACEFVEGQRVIAAEWRHVTFQGDGDAVRVPAAPVVSLSSLPGSTAAAAGGSDAPLDPIELDPRSLADRAADGAEHIAGLGLVRRPARRRP